MKSSTRHIPRFFWLFALMVVVLIAVLFWKALGPADSALPDKVGGHAPMNRPADGGDRIRTADADSAVGSGVTKRPRKQGGGKDGEGEEAPQFPAVEAILADESLSSSETVARLAEIVSRTHLPLLEREEALAHGLNLDFSRFAGLVEDPKLPQPLALRVFDAMLNENQSRDLQVRVCLALMSHEDEGLRAEAAEQLGFYIGFEELVDQPDVLKQEALAFLEDWAKRPPPEPEPVDPDADIPETAPLEPEPVEEPKEPGQGESAGGS